MIKQPLISAVLATVYISLVATLMEYGSKSFEPEKSFLAPIAFLSLFTLSAAVMGYLFVVNPLDLYLSNKKKEAVAFFLTTVAIFALITLIIFVSLAVMTKR